MRWAIVFMTMAILGNGAKTWAADSPAATQPASETAQLVIELRSGDKARVDAAVGKIHTWVASGHFPDAVWKNWLPQLMRLGRFDDAAQIARDAALARPYAGWIGPLMKYRTQALTAMTRPADALPAAKSYYNCCDIKDTPDAVQLVADCLVKAYAIDPGIGDRFKDEQAAASAAGLAGTTLPAAPSMLSAVMIDSQPFEDALSKLEKQTRKVSDRVDYANLLLAAGKSDEAEKVFRKVYETSTTTEDLTTAAEGIARSLRAEDGTMARANAWLVSLQGQK